MVAVITGASSGIGLAAAKEFINAGHSVVCLSRTACSVSGVKSIKCDITNSADIENAFSQIDKIDVLVNNAGFGISGAVEFTDADEMKKQFDLNFFAQVAVTQAALPKLKQSHGKIIFVSSAASVFSIPFQSFYSATKASVEMLACALRNELSLFGVQVGVVRLGDIKTGFTAARATSFKGDEVYGGMIAKSVAVMENDEQNGMAPAAVARAMVRLAGKKKLPLVTTVGAQYKLLCALAKLLPAAAVNKTVGSMYMPK